MKSISLITCVGITAVGLLFASCRAGSNTYSFTYNGAKYEIIKERKSWPDAAMYATKKGGHLVEINNMEEQAAIYNAIKQAGIDSNYATAKDGGDVAYVWIGATDRKHEGQWMWDGDDNGTGSVFWTGEGIHGKGQGSAVNGQYVNWGGASQGRYNEPDNWNGNQNAAAIGLAGWPAASGNMGKAGEWNDINENNQLYFIVEYK